MDNFQLPHSKLFYYISNMYKLEIINDYEKQALRGMYLEEYESSQDEQKFQNNLISLVRQKDISELLKLFKQDDQDSDYKFPDQSYKVNVKSPR
ncbi:hypothetical protein pb186bvf_008463 [Paramecium bursaria]